MILAEVVHQYLTTAPTSQFQGQDVEILDHWQGDQNLLWRIRTSTHDAVLKLFLDAGQARSRRQLRAHEIFASAGLAPIPLWADRYPHGLARQLLVYEWVEGVPLTFTDRRQREILAHALALIHGKDMDELDVISPNPINLATFWQVWKASREPIGRWLSQQRAYRIGQLFQDLWEKTEALVQSALPHLGETTPTPIHGDLRTANVLYRNGTVSFVDWERFGWGDPAQEIGHFLFLVGNDLGQDAKQEWESIYLQRMADYSADGLEALAGRLKIYRQLYPFHALSFLLHGLQREMTASPSQADALNTHRPLLEETILSTLQYAGRDFDDDGAVKTESVYDEIRQEVQQLLTHSP